MKSTMDLRVGIGAFIDWVVRYTVGLRVGFGAIVDTCWVVRSTPGLRVGLGAIMEKMLGSEINYRSDSMVRHIFG